MIEINQPITLSDKTRYQIYSVNMTKDWSSGKWTAIVEFVMLDNDGKPIRKHTIEYPADRFNEFWNGFNNGTFLYEELVRVKNLGLEVPNSESEFLN